MTFHVRTYNFFIIVRAAWISFSMRLHQIKTLDAIVNNHYKYTYSCKCLLAKPDTTNQVFVFLHIF